MHRAPQCLCGRYPLSHALPRSLGDTPHLSASPLSSRPRKKQTHSQLERLASSNRGWQLQVWKGSETSGDWRLLQTGQSCALPSLGCVLWESHTTSLRLTFLGYKRSNNSNLLGLWPVLGEPLALCSTQMVLPEVAEQGFESKPGPTVPSLKYPPAKQRTVGLFQIQHSRTSCAWLRYLGKVASCLPPFLVHGRVVITEQTAEGAVRIKSDDLSLSLYWSVCGE